MFDNYLSDYYRRKITISQICNKERVEPHVFYSYLRSVGEAPFREYYKLINSDEPELDEKLKQIYNGIIQRCNGKSGTPKGYHGLEYLDIREWVSFCSAEKEVLKNLWKEYLDSGKDYKHAVSIDRIDGSKGYTEGNIEFAPLGFNAWKRNIRPVKVKRDGSESWFLSCEEGSRELGVSHSYVGSLLIGSRQKENFSVSESTVDEVLINRQAGNIEDYYQMYIA